jgi:hypothetical protein
MDVNGQYMVDEAPPPIVTVAICEDPSQPCRSDTCEHPADLVIAVSANTADSGASSTGDSPSHFSCVDHWGAIRRGFVRAGQEIRYGEGAPELIVERLSVRLVPDGTGVLQ